MPLLGRHKSLPGSPTGNKQPPAAQPLVCESPLFGTRRQLPVASSATPTSRTTTTTTTATTTRPNLAARCSSPLESGRQSATSSPDDSSPLINSSSANQHLGSIPKQITRQQIHYAFSIMDSNSDGLVDVRDLSQMLANLGVPIDEAILSHVMSTVSKRGDHRISEQEFLDWIGNVIQVSDASSAGQSVGGEGSRRRAVAPSSSSPSSSSSLVAQSAEAQALVAQQMRRRRGSGSGLALMRSLSGSSLAGNQQALRNSESSETKEMEQRKRAEVDEQQQEARNDLKAAFCVFDLDGDGYITIDEVQQGLKLLGESWTQTELNQLLFSKCTNEQQQKVNKRDLSARQQRISIDDFVKLLL